VAPNPNRPRRIGWLQRGEPDSPDEQRKQTDALAEKGWIVGQNVLIDRRCVKFEDLPRAAQDFVTDKMDLIVANGTPATRAAKEATHTIPILMWSAGDPVASGLVASLARPGGNVTGYALLSPERSVKRLSLIRELLPGIRRVAELGLSTNPYVPILHKQLEAAYQTLGMEPIFIDTARIEKVDDVLAETVRRRAQALNILGDALSANWVPQIFSAAVRISLPTIVDSYDLLEAGALLSYELDEREHVRTNAALFDKLLRGTKPAELPVQQPTKFNLAINLRTAEAIGITIPNALLLRAESLIQ
jgi:putative ABC transport system substrate-binding protein